MDNSLLVSKGPFLFLFFFLEKGNLFIKESHLRVLLKLVPLTLTLWIETGHLSNNKWTLQAAPTGQFK